ncbi:MAG TPA: PilZ domain-containing protein [Terracidiphilus sp.]
MDRAEPANGSPGNEGAAALPAGTQVKMDNRSYCAYNQTRECFLGLKVTAGDLPSTHVAEMMLEKPLKSGEGVWMKPFRGIAVTAMPAPLDLIYLDQDCRVIEMAESFPTFQVSSSSPKPESVLALPAHSIYSSQTQSGDQLVLCMAEEMERQLERLTNKRGETEAGPQIAGAALLREKPLWSGGPGLLELEDRNGHDKPEAQQTHSMDLTPSVAKTKGQLRTWFERWWSPDPRKAPRVKEPGLAAYYWNGAAPVAHGVRDISSSGLYVVTEERWYPGTLVLMTLQRTDHGEELAERSIAVQSRAVRWGPDGVGLQFILSDDKDARSGKHAILDAATREEFNLFLTQLKLEG